MKYLFLPLLFMPVAFANNAYKPIFDEYIKDKTTLEQLVKESATSFEGSTYSTTTYTINIETRNPKAVKNDIAKKLKSLKAINYSTNCYMNGEMLPMVKVLDASNQTRFMDQYVARGIVDNKDTADYKPVDNYGNAIEIDETLVGKLQNAFDKKLLEPRMTYNCSIYGSFNDGKELFESMEKGAKSYDASENMYMDTYRMTSQKRIADALKAYSLALYNVDKIATVQESIALQQALEGYKNTILDFSQNQYQGLYTLQLNIATENNVDLDM